MNNSRHFDIALLPAPHIAQKACEISEQLSSEGTLFTLKEGSFYPHVSLYFFPCKQENIQEVSNRLAQLAETLTPFSLTAQKYNQQDGYIAAEYQKTQELQAFQHQVVELINPLRDGLREKDAIRLQTATGLEKENIEQYGYRLVGDLFVPHLTFTRFSDKKAHEVSLPEVSVFSGEFYSLGLFELGENGGCVQEIAKFSI